MNDCLDRRATIKLAIGLCRRYYANSIGHILRRSTEISWQQNEFVQSNRMQYQTGQWPFVDMILEEKFKSCGMSCLVHCDCFFSWTWTPSRESWPFAIYTAAHPRILCDSSFSHVPTDKNSHQKKWQQSQNKNGEKERRQIKHKKEIKSYLRNFFKSTTL